MNQSLKIFILIKSNLKYVINFVRLAIFMEMKMKIIVPNA